MRVSHIGVHKLLQKYKKMRTRLRPMKMVAAVRALMRDDEATQMRDDYETTAIQLHALLASNGYRITL